MSWQLSRVIVIVIVCEMCAIHMHVGCGSARLWEKDLEIRVLWVFVVYFNDFFLNN